MYDPTTGRWTTEDPIGFSAEDMNLYRYVRNDPSNRIDPSGFEEETAISDEFPAKIVWCESGTSSMAWTDEDKATVLKAARMAAERIKKARKLMDDWDNVKEEYRYVDLAGGKRFEQLIWKDINADREWLTNNLHEVEDKLTNAETRVPFYKTNETHEEGNPLYTWSFPLIFTEVGQRIKLRTTYWEIGDEMQAYWTVHEFARFFLSMENDRREVIRTRNSDLPPCRIRGLPPPIERVVRHPGVQSWDRYIEWLKDLK
jgi:hypothetical protein